MIANFLLSLPAATGPRCALRNSHSSRTAGGGKHIHRLLSSLDTAADPSAADRLVRKFVAASSKSAALHTLSHLLSLSSRFALPIYRRVSEANWFKWNPKLAAAMAAVLVNQGRATEAESLISESVSRLNSDLEISLFYCDLIEAFSERGLKDFALDFYSRLHEIPCSVRKPYESMIKALCLMGLPVDAEEKLKEMAFLGFRPSPFEFRLVMQSYGKSGSFAEMSRVLGIMEDAGLAIDTVCTNVVLSCYGDHGELAKMVSWIRKMKKLGIGFSVRTFNVVLNSCPTIISMVQDVKHIPLSIAALVKKVEEDSLSLDEALLVRELVGSSVLVDILEWSPDEGKLDLHGFHVASAFVILLQWVEELRIRFRVDEAVPLEISVVCGSGKHSDKIGESPVKMLVSEMMFQLNSSMRIDRKNAGRFVARGKAVRDWLCQ
ncbi:pentatricopeptide repeat-containing protein At2g17033 [Elaeis guineensis]|uniref:Pentatricopeptide repeat-containing protein At2g17033 n=1 Tax=Elaeis guineensis var. tenera TaxID=51953 RepID=A0A6I9S0V6_ELAGV|nr:pentatricopeptide repeat-containing protein At2g17033 [Elaeis guineensis]